MQRVFSKYSLFLSAIIILALTLVAMLAAPDRCLASNHEGLAVSTMQAKGLNITGKANIEKFYDSIDEESPNYYRHIDITGDTKADVIKVSGDYRKFPATLRIWVNGKHMKTLRFGNWYTIEAITLKNGTPFLCIHGGTQNDERTLIFQFRNGKFVRVAAETALQTKSQGTTGGIIFPKAGGNTLRLTHQLQTFAVGRLDVTFFYKLRNGVLARTANTTASIGYYNGKGVAYGKPYVKASRPFDVYTTNTLSKKAFTVKKGDKIRITALNTHGGKLYLKVYNGKSSGWFRAFAAPRAISHNGYGKRPVLQGCYKPRW